MKHNSSVVRIEHLIVRGETRWLGLPFAHKSTHKNLENIKRTYLSNTFDGSLAELSINICNIFTELTGDIACVAWVGDQGQQVDF